MRTLRALALFLAGLGCLLLLLLVEDADGSVAREDVLLPQDNIVETVAETEKRIKKLVNSGFKMALPYLMSAATEIRLSQSCMHGLLMLLRGALDIKDWAIKMVDALGKPSAGILEGTATAMGDYDECLDITVPKRSRPPATPPYTEKQIAFHGQYCVVQIHLPEGIRQAAMAYQSGNRTHSELANTKTFLRNLIKIAPRADVADLRLGVCIPSICNRNDLQAIVNEVSDMVKFSATAIRCETKQQKEFAVEQILILTGIGLLVLLVVLGTATDVLLRFHFIPQGETLDHDSIAKKSKIIRTALAFSIPVNTQRLLSMTDNYPKIGCIRGMKFISVCLYVVVWTYATPQDFHFLKYRSAFYFHKFMEEWWFTVFANASAGVDTLFLAAGLQISYQMFRKRQGGSVIHIPKFVLKWYTSSVIDAIDLIISLSEFKFTLSQVIVISLVLCLSLLGNGPIWKDVVSPIVKNCKERWWMNLLAINNFWPSDDTCLPHTWLVCCLFHMMLLAPILFFILSKSTTVGIFVNIIIIMGSSVAIAMVTLMNDLPPAPAFYFLSFINIKLIWQKLFIQAYDHIAPFCIGILLGFVLNRYEKIQLKKTTVVFGWCAVVVCNLAVLCGLYGYRHGETMEMTLSAIYASLHRIVWSMGISWIIFACAYGYGGFVTSILAWKVFIPFDRLANLTYLLHPLILFLHEGQLRERMYMAHLDQAMYATAYIVITVALAVLCYVTCAAPFMHFEKMLWYYETRTPPVDENSKRKLGHISVVSDICKDKGKCQLSTTFTETFKRTLKT